MYVGHQGAVHSIAAKGFSLFSGGADSIIREWDVRVCYIVYCVSYIGSSDFAFRLVTASRSTMAMIDLLPASGYPAMGALWFPVR